MPNIDKKYRSYYYEHRNQILHWNGSDTKDLYEKNLKNNYSELKKYGWIYNHFTYKFNSLGFRCDEFSDQPTLMALGCSYTMGIGLPVDKIWPELLAKDLNMKCANLGIGGGSLDTAFRMCEGYIDIINPKLVVLLEPPPARTEIFFHSDNNIPSRIGHWMIDHSNSNIIFEDSIIDFTKIWITQENNYYFNREKNILAIKRLCMERNIKFICEPHTELHYIDKPPESLARDLMHAGITSHEYFVKKLLSKIC
jgi:hypothetical protein